MKQSSPDTLEMFFSDSSDLTEDFCFDKATGIRLNTNMIDYKKSTIFDMDRVTSIINETRSGNAAYSANGILHPLAMPEKILQALGKV